MKTDEWVATALADDDVLVELLLRMKHSAAAAAAPTLAWGIRQPRSKSASAAVRKERDSTTRCSPTTPLSLSSGGGGASPSYDSCRPSDLSSGIRSKGTNANDSIACTSANKRSKRKKFLTEHREEESLLLTERVRLKNEFETVHVTLKKQKVKNEIFKTLETDLHQQPLFETASKSYYAKDLYFCQPKAEEGKGIYYVPAPDNINMHDDHVVAANSFKAEQVFVLPDLNMMPSEDDSAFDSLNCFS